MTKIAIVNLANPLKKLNNTLKSKIDNIKNFVFVDYTGNENDYLEQFHNALRDKTIDVIWFLCGGTNCIKTVNLINWNLVSKSKVIFLGSSDITHFFLFSQKNSSQKFYYFSNFVDFGVNLNEISLSKLFLLLKKKTLNLRFKNKTISLDTGSANIVGGHSIISSLFVNKLSLSLNKKNYYFWEHHGNFETVQMYQYWLEVLKFNCKNLRIKNIILGNSLVYEDNIKIDFDQQYKIAKEILSETVVYTQEQAQIPIPIL